MELILEIILAFITSNIMLAMFSIFYVAPLSTVVFAVINLAKFTDAKKKYDSSTEPSVAEEYKKRRMYFIISLIIAIIMMTLYFVMITKYSSEITFM